MKIVNYDKKVYKKVSYFIEECDDIAIKNI